MDEEKNIIKFKSSETEWNILSHIDESVIKKFEDEYKLRINAAYEYANKVCEISSTIKQHYVPKFYLDQWANEEIVKVTRIKKGVVSSFTQSTKNIAYEDDFYTIEEEAGLSPLFFECAFNQIEGDAAESIAKLVNDDGQISYKDRGAIGLFAAFQYLRTKRSRNNIDLVRDTLIAFAKNHNSEFEIDLSKELPNSFHVRHIFDSSKECFIEIMSRSWTVMNSKKRLITSDEPILMLSVPESLRATGLMNTPQVQLPISPNHMLLMTQNSLVDNKNFDSSSDYFKGKFSKKNTKTANKSIAINANELIFEGPNDDIVSKLKIDFMRLFHERIAQRDAVINQPSVKSD